jgi:hypothetical protein
MALMQPSRQFVLSAPKSMVLINNKTFPRTFKSSLAQTSHRSIQPIDRQ